MSTFEVSDIDWDTDDLAVRLPKRFIVQAESEEEAIDRVSDKTGWCIFNATVKKVG